MTRWFVSFLTFGLISLLSACAPSEMEQGNSSALYSSKNTGAISTIDDDVLDSDIDAVDPVGILTTPTPFPEVNFFMTSPAQYGVVHDPLVLESAYQSFGATIVGRVDYYAIGNYSSTGNWQGCGNFAGNFSWQFCGSGTNSNFTYIANQFHDGYFYFQAKAYDLANQLVATSEPIYANVINRIADTRIVSPEDNSVIPGSLVALYTNTEIITPFTVQYFGRGNWSTMGNFGNYESCGNWQNKGNWSSCGFANSSPWELYKNLREGVYQFFARAYYVFAPGVTAYIDSKVLHVTVVATPIPPTTPTPQVCVPTACPVSCAPPRRYELVVPGHCDNGSNSPAFGDCICTGGAFLGE